MRGFRLFTVDILSQSVDNFLLDKKTVFLQTLVSFELPQNIIHIYTLSTFLF